MMLSMRLHNEPFELIQAGTKTIEMRINDEKRKRLKVGDIIEFKNRVTLERIKVRVTNLFLFKNFAELYKKFSKQEIGYREDEIADPNDMTQYYPIEEQEENGVVAIEFELVNKDRV